MIPILNANKRYTIHHERKYSSSAARLFIYLSSNKQNPYAAASECIEEVKFSNNECVACFCFISYKTVCVYIFGFSFVSPHYSMHSVFGAVSRMNQLFPKIRLEIHQFT